MPPGTEIQSYTVEQEFEKNPDLHKEDVEQLKEWVVAQKHLPQVPDEMLALFHHSCYYNQTRTKDCIDAYYTIRTQASDQFSKRDVADPGLAKSLATVYTIMLPVPDPHGNHIFYHRLRDFEPSHYNHLDSCKLIYMTVDAWLKLNGSTPGLMLIFDFKGTKLGHLTKVSLPAVRYGAKYVQEASPVRLKGIHFINTVSWMDKILAIIKPFTSKEIFDLMHFHKGDFSTLYDHFPRECLPSDLGGSLATIEELNAKNISMLENMTEYFKNEENSRVDETKREKKKKSKKVEVESTATAFKKLDID